MNKVFKLRTLLLFLFIITLAVTIFSRLYKAPEFTGVSLQIDEKFDEKMLIINTCGRLDSLIFTRFEQSNYDTAGTVLFIDEFLRNRFYHSYSELRMQDNWIAVVCGKLLWSDFLYPVKPCDIIKYPMGACSQQGILFQRQLHLLGIPCSTIKFLPLSEKTSGHYAVSVYYNNAWHFYDSNQEPRIIDSTMPGIDVIIDKKLYEKMYIKKSNIRFQEFFKNKSYETVNAEPFRMGNMYYFQTITDFLSDWLWLIFLTLYLLLLVRTKRG